jgi:hypothetical protein
MQKRQRERKRDEKAAQKREGRAKREASRDPAADAVATREDLEGYGLGPAPADSGAERDDGIDREG